MAVVILRTLIIIITAADIMTMAIIRPMVVIHRTMITVVRVVDIMTIAVIRPVMIIRHTMMTKYDNSLNCLTNKHS